MVENQDHDKVIIRMDGSRRLTTRNRMFVKQILSPPDLPEMVDIPCSPVQKHGPSSVVGTVANEVSTTQCHDNTPRDVSNLAGTEQFPSWADDEVNGEVADDDSSQANDMETYGQLQSPAPSGNMIQPAVGRPTRASKPNVRFNAAEYDLSEVSAYKKNLLISEIHVKQGTQKNRGKY